MFVSSELRTIAVNGEEVKASGAVWASQIEALLALFVSALFLPLRLRAVYFMQYMEYMGTSPCMLPRHAARLVSRIDMWKKPAICSYNQTADTPALWSINRDVSRKQ